MNELDKQIKEYTLKYLKWRYKRNSLDEIKLDIYKCKLCNHIKIFSPEREIDIPNTCCCDNACIGIYELVGHYNNKDMLRYRVREIFDAFWERLYINDLGEVAFK